MDLNFPLSFCKGLTARVKGEANAARAAFLQAREEVNKTVNEQPNYGPGFSVLGLIDAALGRKEDALREGRHAIELLPTSEFPGDLSWGYNPAQIFAVESSYGGAEGVKRLIDAAHSQGIAIIFDVVYNHFGPSDLSIWQFDGWFERWNGMDMGGIYFYNDWRAWTPWGEKNRPDYGRPEVRQFIRDNALMWLEECRGDGLRFDSTIYIRNVYGHNNDSLDDPNNLAGWGWNLLRWINDEVEARQPWKLTIRLQSRSRPIASRRTARWPNSKCTMSG